MPAARRRRARRAACARSCARSARPTRCARWPSDAGPRSRSSTTPTPTRSPRAAAGCDAAVHLVGILKETRANRYADAHERPCAGARGRRRPRRAAPDRARSRSWAPSPIANACLASRARADAILLAREDARRRDPRADGARRGRPRLAPRSRARRADRARGSCAAAPRSSSRSRRATWSPRSPPRSIARGSTTRARARRPRVALAPRARRARRGACSARAVAIASVPAALAHAFAWLAERTSADPPITRAMLGVLEPDDAIDPEPARAKLGIELTPLDAALREALREDGRDEPHRTATPPRARRRRSGSARCPGSSRSPASRGSDTGSPARPRARARTRVELPDGRVRERELGPLARADDPLLRVLLPRRLDGGVARRVLVQRARAVDGDPARPRERLHHLDPERAGRQGRDGALPEPPPRRARAGKSARRCCSSCSASCST